MVFILPAVMIFAPGLLPFDNTCTPLPLWSYQIATVAFVVPGVMIELNAFALATAAAALYVLIAADILELKLNLVVLASGYTS